MDFKVTGSDKDGVTQVSLEALESYKDKVLETVFLNSDGETIFVFKDHTAYSATGFSYGYGGEGPHGLHKAIRMFSDRIDEDFYNTSIPVLIREKDWVWGPQRGFTHRW